MIAHGATGQGTVRPEADEQTAAAHGALASTTQPGQQQPPEDNRVESRVESAEEQSRGDVETKAEEIAKVALATTALAIGVPVLIVAALFTAGFLRRPIERAIERMVIRIADIQVSSGLPLAIMEILREVRADMDVASAMSAYQRAKD